MNILVVGLGSMGKRRIRLLNKHFQNINVFGVDYNYERRKFCEETYQIVTYQELNEAISLGSCQIAFICTPPLSHHKIISECLRNNLNVFTELNLVNTRYQENIDLAQKNNLTLFLSSTFLYRKETKYIIDRVGDCNCLLNYSYHVGQYLPEWHPWENFKDCFIGNKKTNGCREIFAIDLPWIIKAFGKVESINVISNKMTNLDIDYNDNYLVTIVHETGHKGIFIADVVARDPVRKLEVYVENLQIQWEGEPETLKEFDIDLKKYIEVKTYEHVERLKEYASQIIEDEYLDEIKAFFSVLDGKIFASYTFEDDLYVLKLIDSIEGMG